MNIGLEVLSTTVFAFGPTEVVLQMGWAWVVLGVFVNYFIVSVVLSARLTNLEVSIQSEDCRRLVMTANDLAQAHAFSTP